MTKDEFIEEWRHFCNKCNFGQSALDARAIRFMNEFEININEMLEGK